MRWRYFCFTISLTVRLWCKYTNYFRQFGNLARFCSAIWRVFVRQLGAISFGNLAHFCSATWRKFRNLRKNRRRRVPNFVSYRLAASQSFLYPALNFFCCWYKNYIQRGISCCNFAPARGTGPQRWPPSYLSINSKLKRTLTFCYKPALQSVRQTGRNAQCRPGATQRRTGMGMRNRFPVRTPVVLGDSPRRQGCLVTRIEPSSASTPRAHKYTTAACHRKGSMRLFCFCQ